jgi:hypothetical protein
MTAKYDEEQAHVDPAEETELSPELVALEIGNEADEA